MLASTRDCRVAALAEAWKQHQSVWLTFLAPPPRVARPQDAAERDTAMGARIVTQKQTNEKQAEELAEQRRINKEQAAALVRTRRRAGARGPCVRAQPLSQWMPPQSRAVCCALVCPSVCRVCT